jgi:hypothetical protein
MATKKSKFDVKAFVKEINDEWDLEVLSLLKSLITKQEIEVKRLIDIANHTQIKGYKRYENMNIKLKNLLKEDVINS